MARYNTSSSNASINGATTINSPNAGLLTNFTGTAPYTVTLPSPVLYSGIPQFYYNATSGVISVTTPSGIFTGAAGSGSTSLAMPATTTLTIVSDGTNYVVTSSQGGPLLATTGSFSSTLTATAAVSMNPSNASVSIQPTGTGVTSISSGTVGSIVNMNIGTSSPGSGAFTSLTANGQGSFTASTISTNSSTGALTVTGGLGVGGAVNLGGTLAVATSIAIGGSATIKNADGLSGATDARLLFGNTTSNYAALRMVFNSTTCTSIDSVSWGSSSPETILSLQGNGGKVAIGSATSNYILGVVGNIGTTGITISTGGGTNVANTVNIDTDGSGIARYYSHGSNSSSPGGHAFRLASSDGSIDNMGLYIAPNGSVGVGTTYTTGGYTFNVAKSFRANGMALGNSDGSSTSDDRFYINWSSGSNAYIYANQNVPFYLGSNNATQLTLQPGVVSVNTNQLNFGNEMQSISTTGSSGGTGPYEMFRVPSTYLCTSGFFSISATRGSYVHTSTWAWSSSHNGSGQGTITMLSSNTYSNMTMYLDVAYDGAAIISADWGGAQGYAFTVMKTGGGTLSVGSNGTDRNSTPSGYTRYSRATISSGFAANNGKFDGSLSKGSGSFKISHPLPELSETNYLVHSFIEGPNADLIYRGEVTLVDGQATVDIDQNSRMTEGTFEVLCRKVQCFTTNETDWTPVRGKVTGNILTIEAQDPESTATVSWMVIGERKDPHMYETEWTDETGEVIVEPLKNPVETDFPEYPEDLVVVSQTNPQDN
jgi:hypothetical protein